MKRQIRCKCGWEGPDNDGIGMCPKCAEKAAITTTHRREVGGPVFSGRYSKHWKNIRDGDVVRLVGHPGMSETHYSGFTINEIYKVHSHPVNMDLLGPMNELGQILGLNEYGLLFVFDELADEAPPMPKVKPPKPDTQKVEFEYIADLCKFTRCSFLMYLDWENDNVMKYQITRHDEYQTEVTSVEEAVEVLETLEGNQKRLNKWEWI